MISNKKYFTIKIGIIVCIIAIILAGIVKFTQGRIGELKRESFIGTWKLHSENTVIRQKINLVNGTVNIRKVFIDEELLITSDNSYYESVLVNCNTDNLVSRCDTTPPFVRLIKDSNVVEINFSSEDGESVLICFKKNKNMLLQTPCLGNTGFADSSYIKDNFNIIYKKSIGI